MISKVYSGAISPDKLIAEHLAIVIAVYAVVIFAGRRQWLRPQELTWVGAAMIFWAVAWLLQPVLSIVRDHYPSVSMTLPVSIGLITPIVVAMVFGLRYTARRSGPPKAA